MAHYNHPRELTEYSISAINLLQKAGAIIVNQTPLIKGVNDDAKVLSDLFRNLHLLESRLIMFFSVARRWVIILMQYDWRRLMKFLSKREWELLVWVSGRVFVMSHHSGKIEVVGKTEDYVFFRYHRAADLTEKSKFVVVKSNPTAYWFDDYEELVDEFTFANPFIKISAA